MFEDIGMLITQEIGRTAIPLGEIALRLGLAALLAGILGLEREVRGRAAGLRTHMLVSLAAATFTVGALELLYWAEELDKGVAQIDPARALESITAGVAFLAAGTIIRSGERARGLTTGAGMWLAGSVGLVAGMGLYAFAVVATLIGLVVLHVLRWLEGLAETKPRRKWKE